MYHMNFVDYYMKMSSGSTNVALNSSTARCALSLLISVTINLTPSYAQRAVDEFNATFVEPDDIFSVEADIFAPCALGGMARKYPLLLKRCHLVRQMSR
jgi:hypothetical protein